MTDGLRVYAKPGWDWALHFAEADNKVQMGDVLDFPGTAPFTLEAKIRWDAAVVGSNPRIIDKAENVSGFQGYAFYANKANARVSLVRWGEGTGPTGSSATDSVPSGRWVHVAAVYDGADIQMFVEGVASGSPVASANSLTDNGGNFWVGLNFQSGDDFLGEIAEVRVWDDERTAAEILANKDVRLVGDEAGLVGYWRLDEGAGSTVEDLSIGRNDGTITGATWDKSFLGVERQVKQDSLMVEDRIEQRSVARFDMPMDSGGPPSPAWTRGDPVSIVRGVETPIFKGFIDSAVLTPKGPDAWVYQVQCMDLHYLADRRVVAESYTGQTAAYIFKDLRDTYLVPEGVGASDSYIDTGPIITEIVFNYVSCAMALDALAELAGFYWRIRPDNDCEFRPRDAVTHGLPGWDWALHFAESNNKVDMGDVMDFVGTSPFTFEAKVRWGAAVAGTYPRIIDKIGTSGGLQGYTFAIDKSNSRLTLWRWLNSVPDMINGGVGKVPSGEWVHVAATYDGTNMRLYIEGVLDGSPSPSSKSLTDNAGTFRVGLDYLNTNDWLGEIADVRVWDDERTAAEILANKDVRLVGNETGLVGYWPMDEGGGSTVEDKTTGGNDGTITGCDWVRAFTMVITDQIAKRAQGVTVEHANPLYRNRQFIHGGTDITDALVESFKGDGEITAFTVGFPIAEVPTVKVNTVAKTVGIKGVDTGKDWYWNKGHATVVQDTGGGVLTSSDTLEVTYKGEFEFVALSEDPAEIELVKAREEQGTGYVEDVAEMAGDKITSRQQAFDIANAKLAKFGVIAKRLVLTVEAGAAGYVVPGTLLTVNLPNYGISAEDFLVESVQWWTKGRVGLPDAEGQVFQTITAVTGPQLGDWTRFFYGIAAQPTISRLVNVGSGAVLTVYVPVSEGWTWGETAPTVTVWACPVPSTTLYPVTTLYPC